MLPLYNTRGAKRGAVLSGFLRLSCTLNSPSLILYSLPQLSLNPPTLLIPLACPTCITSRIAPYFYRVSWIGSGIHGNQL